MSLTRRIRTVYLSQIKALKDHMERVDLGLDSDYANSNTILHAKKELHDSLETGGASPLAVNPTSPAEQEPIKNETDFPQSSLAVPADPMLTHYKLLGVPRDADIPTVKEAWMNLRKRCDPTRFPEGSDEKNIALNIRNRVDGSWKAIRDSQDPQSGRFEKLEI